MSKFVRVFALAALLVGAMSVSYGADGTNPVPTSPTKPSVSLHGNGADGTNPVPTSPIPKRNKS